MANNVLLFFWDWCKMGCSRKIKRCLSGGVCRCYLLEIFGYLLKKWTYPKNSGIFWHIFIVGIDN